MLSIHDTSSQHDEATPATQPSHEPAPPASHAPQDAEVPSDATTANSDASDALDTSVAALANDLQYTFTVGQARELFAEHGRKVPAERTLQNYCIEGSLAAQKIRTTYGSEWLINEASLLALIESQPIVVAVTQPSHEPAPPASHAPQYAEVPSDASDALAPHAPPMPAGEKRTIADVLIENAKLVATIEGKEQVIRGKDETIAELKDDRAFLRDEVRESREQRKDVKEIASRMLDAMQNIAIAGKLPPAATQGDTITARVIDSDESTSPHV